MHQKKIAFGEFFFSRLRRDVWHPPRGGEGLYNPPHRHTATHPYTAACIHPESGPKMVKNDQNCPKSGEIIRGGPPENRHKIIKFFNIGKMAKNAPTVQVKMHQKE